MAEAEVEVEVFIAVLSVSICTRHDCTMKKIRTRLLGNDPIDRATGKYFRKRLAQAMRL